MRDLVYNLQYDFYDNIIFYFIGCFVFTVILIFIYEFIDWNIIRIAVFVSAISVFVLISLFVVTKVVVIDSEDINEIKNTYNIKQQGDELKFTKKDDIYDIIYKKEAKFKITKEKITNNYDYDNEHISETQEEYYILTDTYNNKKAKLNKEQLKQLISYTKSKEEKFNVDGLK